MAEWVMRIWLPDRPGSLASVAAAIGAAGADVVAMDVVERGGGTAIDDLTVELASTAVSDLISAVSRVDGVSVEEVRRGRGWRASAGEALSAAAQVLDRSRPEPFTALCETVAHSTGADWVALAAGNGLILGSAGCPPDTTWLANFAAGVGCAPHAVAVVDGVAFVAVCDGGLMVGRSMPDLSTAEVEDVSGWAAVAALLRRDRASRGSQRDHEAG